MRTYLINTIGQIPTTNRQLDYKSTLKTNEWVVFNDKQGDVEKFLFLDGDKLLVSLNGKTAYSKWQYMKVNSSLVIDDGDNKYMFKIIVCNKDIILLNVDSTDSCSFLINTKSEALENCTYKEIQWYLKKICGVDIFNTEQRIEYENVQRKLIEKEEIIRKKKQKRLKIVFALIIGVVVSIIIFYAITLEQSAQAEYNRLHPTMGITENKNRSAVDLGLSVKWAKCNIGANKPTELGNEYGWGDTSGIIYTNYTGNYPNEEYVVSGDGEISGKHEYKEHLTKNDRYAYPTRKDIPAPQSIINTQYDVAKQCWGEGWRMPTKEEVQELIDNCTIIYQNDCVKVIGPSGNIIFFPVGGWVLNNEYATGELKEGMYIYSLVFSPEARISSAKRSNHLRVRAVHD